MKKLIYASLIFFAFTACKNNQEKDTAEELLKTEQEPDMHTSKIALDWDGVYKGILPCADCDGIATEITIKSDKSYVIKRLYLGKDDNFFEETGTLKWTEDGSSIVLTEKVKGSPTLFKVGENYLLHLDQKGEIIEGEMAERYILRKE